MTVPGALRDVLLIAAGGAAGSVARHLVGRAMGTAPAGQVPWHTFAVNASGAFAIGLLIVLSARMGWPGWWRPLIAVGVLGGYTTFSTFSIEVVELAMRGSWWTAAAYGGGSLATGVAAAACGILVGRALA